MNTLDKVGYLAWFVGIVCVFWVNGGESAASVSLIATAAGFCLGYVYAKHEG